MCVWVPHGLTPLYAAVHDGNFSAALSYPHNNAITVRYSPYTSEWRISNKSATGFGDIMATETYGTRRANAYKILEEP